MTEETLVEIVRRSFERLKCIETLAQMRERRRLERQEYEREYATKRVRKKPPSHYRKNSSNYFRRDRKL